MKQALHLIILCDVLALLTACSSSGSAGRGSEADSIYAWEMKHTT